MAAERIDAEQAQHDLEQGALLVCAYDDDAKYEKYCLEGSIPLSQFRTQERTIPKDRELIFYCA